MPRKKPSQLEWNNKFEPNFGQKEGEGVNDVMERQIKEMGITLPNQQKVVSPNNPQAAQPEQPKQEANLAGGKALPKDVQSQQNPAKQMDASGKVELPEGLTWARTCEKCGKGMIEGFVIDGGMSYYCSEECLHKDVSPEEWEQLYNEGDGDSYWTEWYEEEGEWFEE
jgi:hypothetical protein